MATFRHMEIARDIMVAWMSEAGKSNFPQQPSAKTVGEAFKEIVKAVSEAEKTSFPGFRS